MQRLYSLGARKIAVVGLPPIGCLPIQMTENILLPGSHMRVCVQQQNEDSVVYNLKLQSLLPSIQASRPGTTIAYLDAYDALLNMIIIPEEYGKKVDIVCEHDYTKSHTHQFDFKCFIFC